MAPPSNSLPESLPDTPWALLLAWQQQAFAAAAQPNPNAMVLATVDASGAPAARVVLCKDIVPTPGYLTFYTNYQSDKGTQLQAQPKAAAVMHWDHAHRQVRITGPVERLDAVSSDAYFASRHWHSRVGAWASAQSQVISDMATLRQRVNDAADRLRVPRPSQDNATRNDIEVPRPPHWGGYRLWAASVELWCEGDARIHERARWQRELRPTVDGYAAGPWAATRLQP
jgi:pyridoxamine 5'-phosphate oxidase